MNCAGFPGTGAVARDAREKYGPGPVGEDRPFLGNRKKVRFWGFGCQEKSSRGVPVSQQEVEEKKKKSPGNGEKFEGEKEAGESAPQVFGDTGKYNGRSGEKVEGQ